MKRMLAGALMGAALLMPMEADGQRNRSRNRPVERYVEASRSGRLVDCRAPRDGRAYVCRDDRADRVVYHDDRPNRVVYRSARDRSRWGRRYASRTWRYTQTRTIASSSGRTSSGSALTLEWRRRKRVPSTSALTLMGSG